MKRTLLVFAMLGLASCAGEDSTGKVSYANSDPQLAVANGAFMTCTCIFTMEMSEDFCAAWTKATPSVARVGIDYVNKTVESSAFITYAARAHWVDDKRGCVLE